jgi:hypothetical protein
MLKKARDYQPTVIPSACVFNLEERIPARHFAAPRQSDRDAAICAGWLPGSRPAEANVKFPRNSQGNVQTIFPQIPFE